MESDTGKLLIFADAARLPWLPRRRGGKKISLVTFWRWSRRGVCGVVLPTHYVGSTPTVTERELQQFFTDVAEAKRRGGQTAPTVQSPAQRRRAVDGATRRLAAKGIGA
jgi:hypothetical protein